MRIAMLGHKRIPSHEGGIEVVVEELAARMVEKGHQVTCFNRMSASHDMWQRRRAFVMESFCFNYSDIRSDLHGVP